MKSDVVNMCCTSQDKVQQVQKGTGNICYVRLLQSRDLYQGTFIFTNKLRRYHDNHQDQNIIKCGRKSETEAISDLELTSLSGTNVWIKLPVSYTRENLPVGGEDIAAPDKIRDWKNLCRIAHKIIQVKISVLVFLLVAIVPRHWNH